MTGTEIFLALALKGTMFAAFSIISEKRERRASAKHAAKPVSTYHLVPQPTQVVRTIEQRPRYHALPGPSAAKSE